MTEEHEPKEEWQRQTYTYSTQIHTHTNTHTHSVSHTPIPKGQTAFVSVMRGSEQRKRGFIGKRAVVFSSPKSLVLIREDISGLEKST